MICRHCGNEFDQTPGHVSICSTECIKARAAERSALTNRNKVRVVLPPRHCKICGDEFLPIKKHQILCGANECRKAYNRNREKLVRDKAKADILEITDMIPCKMCDTMFIPSGKWKVCCSPKCSQLNASHGIHVPVARRGKVVIPEEYLVRGLVTNSSHSTQISNGEY